MKMKNDRPAPCWPSGARARSIPLADLLIGLRARTGRRRARARHACSAKADWQLALGSQLRASSSELRDPSAEPGEQRARRYAKARTRMRDGQDKHGRKYGILGKRALMRARLRVGEFHYLTYLVH